MDSFIMKINQPIPLKPSPPAYTHQLSYNTLHKKTMQEDIERSKTDSLLKEINQHKNNLLKQDKIFAGEREQLQQNILMLSMEN